MRCKMIDYDNLSTYDYELPQNLIAQSPLEKRDNSKLLVYDRKSKQILDKHFYDITEFLKSGDVLVINTSKVLPARLYGIKRKTNAKIEILLHKRIDENCWEIILKPFKRVSVGTLIDFSNELSGTIIEKKEEGVCKIKFEFKGIFEEIISKIGEMPLPHYIHNKLKDAQRYQTVYSKQLGSSAAPTAGLHFTEELLKQIKQKGVTIVEVILHVGLGTFRPVKDDNIKNHKMHSEYFVLNEENAKIINQAKQEGRRIFAVGTTSVRVLESCADENNRVVAKSGETSIFIHPPYKFKIVDCLITNFHLPKSTLIMLVSAFSSLDETLKVYRHAIKNDYRFFSFGDANLIL